MSQGNTNGSSAPDPKAERMLDLDARPELQPTCYLIRHLGIEYQVRQMSQLTGQEEDDLTMLERKLDEAKTTREVRRAMFDWAFTLVRLLVPSMPVSVRMTLDYDQARAIANEAWAYTREGTSLNPPVADTGAAPAPDSSAVAVSSKPVSAAPTAAIPVS